MTTKIATEINLNVIQASEYVRSKAKTLKNTIENITSKSGTPRTRSCHQNGWLMEILLSF